VAPVGNAPVLETARPGAAQTPESKLGPIPLIQPPYAHLVAIDLNAGEIVWKVPFGEGSREMREHPLLRGVELPERLGTRGNSGPMVTKGGLVFLGGAAPYLHAFDKATDVEVWRGATPFRTYANPMTYCARSGRQFIVISTGAGSDAALVAFARPE
ncbi:MAG: PQQ-binding-like beta-propeller repeat protein, partial [Rhodospirillaceae bacterium]|nr:PQQ-binding-like beta-propeller repeat protein [Rhodospirillaceae bacterium]